MASNHIFSVGPLDIYRIISRSFDVDNHNFLSYTEINEHTTRIREFPRKKMVIVVRGNYEDIIR